MGVTPERGTKNLTKPDPMKPHGCMPCHTRDAQYRKFTTVVMFTREWRLKRVNLIRVGSERGSRWTQKLRPF